MTSNISTACDSRMLSYMAEVQIMVECPGPRKLRFRDIFSTGLRSRVKT